MAEEVPAGGRKVRVATRVPAAEAGTAPTSAQVRASARTVVLDWMRTLAILTPRVHAPRRHDVPAIMWLRAFTWHGPLDPFLGNRASH